MTTTYAPGMSSVNPNLPPDFPQSAAFWASHFGIDVKTFREWIDRYAIPHFLPGRERFCKPSDVLAKIPYVQPGLSPPQEE